MALGAANAHHPARTPKTTILLAEVEKKRSVYHTVEIITKKQLRISYIIWLSVLAFAGATILLAGFEYDCLPFCSLSDHSQRCSLSPIRSPPTCFTDGADRWTSNGTFSPRFVNSSVMREFNRIMIYLRHSIPKPTNVTVTLYDEDGQVLLFHDSPYVDAGLSNTRYSISMPNDYTSLPNGVTKLEFSSSTWAGRLNQSSVEAIYYLSEKPNFARTREVIRYVAFIAGVLGAVQFVYSHALVVVTAEQHDADVHLTRLEALVIWRVYRKFKSEHKAALLFHLLIVLSLNPFTLLEYVFPLHPTLWFVVQHLFPLVKHVTFMIGGVVGFTVMGHMRLLGRRSFLRKVVLLCVMVGAPPVALDLWSIIATPHGNRPRTTKLAPQGASIAIFALDYWWYFVCILLFWQRRTRMVWNSSRPGFYRGRIRIIALWLRVVMSYGIIYVYYQAFFMTPLIISFSAFLPLDRTAEFMDILIANALSGTVLFLLAPQSLSRHEAPPNPLPTETVSASSVWNVKRQFSSQIFGGDDEEDQNNDDRSEDADEGTELQSPSSATIAAVELQSPPCLAWQSLDWEPQHFKFIENHRCGGFQFLTEEEQERFNRRHEVVRNGRSFYCWETAFSSLNLAYEVYYEPEGKPVQYAEDRDRDVGKCEVCITRVFFPSNEKDVDTATAHLEKREEGKGAGKLTKSDDGAKEKVVRKVVVATPPPAMATPKLNTQRHGYELFKCLLVRGVQVIICATPGLLSSEAAPNLDPSSSTNWNPKRLHHIVIAFRGTVNAANIATDLDMSKVVFDEMIRPTQGKAKLHRGFNNVWQRMREVLFAQLDDLWRLLPPKRKYPLRLCGHSLGGALACVAQYSFEAGVGKSLAERRVSEVSSYTFGMPRLGNLAFVEEFNAKCLQAYRVVRENDRITTMGVFGHEHVGHEVVVDRDGNSAVGANVIEEAYNMLSGAGSTLNNHRLIRYATAFDACMAASERPLDTLLFKSVVALEEQMTAGAPLVDVRGSG